MRTHTVLNRFSACSWAFAALLSAGCDDGGDAASLNCGEGTVERVGNCVIDPEAARNALAPTVKSIQITQLDVYGEELPFHTLHPMEIAFSLAVDGEAFETDVLVGLQTPDGSAGCTTGSFKLNHIPPLGEDAEPLVVTSVNKEVIISPSCKALEGRDDVEVFLSFDPWHTLNLDGRAPIDRRNPPTDSIDFFDFAKLSAVPFADDCRSDIDGDGDGACRSALELLENPGIDIEIQTVTFDNAVAIVEVPVEEIDDVTQAEAIAANEAAGIPIEGEFEDDVVRGVKVELPTVPELKVSTTFRVLGLREDESMEDDQIDFEILIRPLAGAIGAEDLEDDDFEWRPMFEREQFVDADGEFQDQETNRSDVTHIVGPESHGLKKAMYFANDTYESLIWDEWSEIQEFEVLICFESEFRETDFDGLFDPESNNCTVLPVIVLRRYETPFGARDELEQGGLDDGAASTWSRDKSYAQTWGTVDGGQTQVSNWLTMGHTKTGANFGLGGSSINGRGGWYEAGTESRACVFGSCLTLARAVATMKDQQAAADTITMEGRVLLWHFFPYVSFSWPDGTVTLNQAIDLANRARRQDYSTSKSFEQDIVGKSFETDCGGAKASIKAFVEMGLDGDETSISKAPVAPADAACAGRTVENGYCFAPAQVGQNQGIYQMYLTCQAKYGPNAYPALLRTPRDYELAREAVGPNRWYLSGVYGYVLHGNWLGLGYYNTPGSTIHRAWAPGQPSNANVFNTSLRSNDLVYHTVHITPDDQMWVGEFNSAAAYGVCSIKDVPNIDGGSAITVTVTPYIQAGVKSSLGTNFSTVDIDITITLNLLDAKVPFVGTLRQLFNSDGTVTLSLGRSIQMTLSTLSGNIKFTMKWKTFWTQGQHEKTLASWAGWNLGRWWILPHASTSTLL